ncbi:hypothetical protein [Flectobacillus roseus]|uniref:Uncharacterized protein n=1 Tax=Flectobacillus roseus TaxID=502259 RepID=A0ABT6Y2C9_9BACT|nr:hypothetical protein [Flectobacillus roseus]MDI9857718.1 hypothetical protein [Flectobacillus roseus]MDI9869556.1 hypothetical protein [Flectobacillus roseus]
MTETIIPLWTNEDFNNMGWHDNRLYGIIFDTQNFRISLDIDYIFEWSDSWKSFLVAPCSLNFENVSNTNIKIEFGDTQNIIISCVKRINESKTPNGNLQWFFIIETDVGDISFWATGFTQKLRDEPIWSTAQDLDRIPSF